MLSVKFDYLPEVKIERAASMHVFDEDMQFR